MNDRSKVANNHAQRGDVLCDSGKIDVNLNCHSQSPVGCDDSTVEAPRRSCLAPLGMAGGVAGSPVSEPHPDHISNDPQHPVHAGLVAHGGTAVIRKLNQNKQRTGAAS